MKAWTDLILSFALGLAAGIVLAVFYFNSRLRLYKEYIEHRLAEINRLRPANASSWSLPKWSFWKAVLIRRSKAGERSKGTQNK